jgi:hypothetical protein
VHFNSQNNRPPRRRTVDPETVMTKILPVFLALIPLAAIVGACAATA